MTVLTVINSSSCRQDHKTNVYNLTVKGNFVMKVDAGASLSIINEATYQSLLAAKSQPPLRMIDIKVHTYTKELLQVLGSTEIEVIYKEQSTCLPLLVVEAMDLVC